MIIVMCLLFSIYPAINSYSAASPVLPYNLTWDINNIHYFITSSATSYATPISAASANWWRPFGPGSNSLYPNTRTYNQTYSAIDYYAYSDSTSNCNAYTTFIINPSQTAVSPYASNWSFGRIYINSYYANRAQGGFPLPQTQQGIAAHEQGHVFGLDEHNSNIYSIMCQTSSGRAVYTVQVTDNNYFNVKHP